MLHILTLSMKHLTYVVSMSRCHNFLSPSKPKMQASHKMSLALGVQSRPPTDEERERY